MPLCCGCDSELWVCCLSLQGRISRRVTVPLPDEAGRAAILGVHLRAVELDETAGDKTQLARQLAALTTGFSGEWGSVQWTPGRHRAIRVSGQHCNCAALAEGCTSWWSDSGMWAECWDFALQSLPQQLHILC